MPQPSLWERLRGARVVRVLVVYLGATWVVLQLVDTLAGLLSLPDWVGPVAVVLLAVGLVVVLATAWVQSLPSTTRREEAGEVPSDWQVAPSDVLASLKAGRLPHLTWGRAILGGVVALSLLIGVAGGYVLVTGTRAPGFGPSDLGAGEAAAGIAVVPFTVTGGSDLGLWREGMVDVLSTNLDGMGGFRAIDARTVMAQWRKKVGDTTDPDLRTALEAAGGTGARFGLVGSLVGTPNGVRVSADVYDLSSGDKVTQSYVQGPADSVLALVSRLSVDVVRSMLSADGQHLVQAPRTAGITTESLEALRQYLDGEAAYRRSDFPTAAAAFERAVEADSTFALAWYRLATSYGWMESLGSATTERAGARAEALVDHLPLRERTLMVAVGRGIQEGDLTALPDLRQAANKYPDDPEVWFDLGEFYVHRGIDAGVATWADALDVFTKAVSLDPTFGPYYIHYIETLVGMGKGTEARAALDTYAGLVGSDVEPHLTLAVALFGGDPAARQAALAGLDTVPDAVLDRMGVEIPWFEALDSEQTLAFFRAAEAKTGKFQWISLVAATLFRQGRLRELATEFEDDPSAPVPAKVAEVATRFLVGFPVSPTLAEATRDLDVCPDRDDAGADCMYYTGAVAAFRGDRATWRKWVDRNHALAERYRTEGQGAHGLEHAALAQALEGIWAAEQDRKPESAKEMLRQGSDHLPGALAYGTRLELAKVLAGTSPRDAAELLGAMTSTPLAPYAMLRLGRIREQLGDQAAARGAYQRASEILAHADEDFAPAREAREALARLGG